MPKKSPPERVRHLPDVLLDALEKLSDGDWRRVTLGPDGDVVVHNQAQVFRVELEPQGTTAKKLSESARRPAPTRPVADTAPASQQSVAPALSEPSSARPRPYVVLPPAIPHFRAPEGTVGASTS
jgi:hypothetical protein